MRKEKEDVEEKLSHIVDMLLENYKSKKLYLKKQFDLQNKMDEVFSTYNKLEKLIEIHLIA